MFVVFLTVFIDLLGFGMVLPLLPIYAERFTIDKSGLVLGLLMSSFSIMQFLFSPLWGRLSDRIGRRPVLLIGLTGSTVFYALFGVATAMESLVAMFASRIGAGIFGATIPAAQAYIADTTTKADRAKGMALIGAAFGLGFTFGPLLAITAVKTSASGTLSPWPGYTAAGLSCGALLLAIFKLPESLNPNNVAPERRWIDVPMLKQALSLPTIRLLLVTFFISVLAFTAVEAVLSILLAEKPLQGGFGYTFVHVLQVYALVGFTHALGQGMVRAMVKRFSEVLIASIGIISCLGGYVVLIMATKHHSLGLLLTGLIVEAIGFAFIPPSVQGLISRRSDPAQQGGILGVAQSMSSLARILGHAVGIPLFYLAATAPFWTGGAIMAVALVLIRLSATGGKDFAEPASTPAD